MILVLIISYLLHRNYSLKRMTTLSNCWKSPETSLDFIHFISYDTRNLTLGYSTSSSIYVFILPPSYRFSVCRWVAISRGCVHRPHRDETKSSAKCNKCKPNHVAEIEAWSGARELIGLDLDWSILFGCWGVSGIWRCTPDSQMMRSIRSQALE